MTSQEEQRFWKLYRRERKKLGPDAKQLTVNEIVHVARAARRRLDEETTGGKG